MFRRNWIVVGLLALAIAVPPVITGQDKSSQSKTSSKKSKSVTEADRTFAKQAASDNEFQREMAQMAQQKASSPDVKSLAERLLTDHSGYDDMLKPMAENEHVSVPGKLDDAHKKIKDRLSKLSGKEFDRAYTLFVIQEHNRTLLEYQREAKSGNDPALKKFASDTLPLLQLHQKIATDVETKLKTVAKADTQ